SLATFRAGLAAHGATLAEPQWLGAKTPHRVLCHAGHECEATPHRIKSGRRVYCPTCAAPRPRKAISHPSQPAVRAGLHAIGATLLDPVWLGSHHPHQVRCAAGHNCKPCPVNVLRGQGICIDCGATTGAAKRSTKAAERFHTDITAAGGQVLEPT